MKECDDPKRKTEDPIRCWLGHHGDLDGVIRASHDTRQNAVRSFVKFFRSNDSELEDRRIGDRGWQSRLSIVSKPDRTIVPLQKFKAPGSRTRKLVVRYVQSDQTDREPGRIRDSEDVGIRRVGTRPHIWWQRAVNGIHADLEVEGNVERALKFSEKSACSTKSKGWTDAVHPSDPTLNAKMMGMRDNFI